jgi:phosphoribosylglycinamide formyltransferase-1
MNIAFFASGNGSSAQAITDACFCGDLMAAPALLISDKEDAAALKWASEKGLKTAIMNKKTHADARDRDIAIADKLKKQTISLLVLSGYMKLVGPHTLRAVSNKAVNIHPALLPKYGGQGMYGSNVHKAVHAAGETKTGITIHQVNAEYDRGVILAQKELEIPTGATANEIEEMVKASEPSFYVETLRRILKGQIQLQD